MSSPDLLETPVAKKSKSVVCRKKAAREKTYKKEDRTYGL